MLQSKLNVLPVIIGARRSQGEQTHKEINLALGTYLFCLLDNIPD